MKYLSTFFTLQFSLFTFSLISQTSWIRINQLGYLPNDVKVAVLVSKETILPTSFKVCDALTGKTVFQTNKITPFGTYHSAFVSTFRLDFSDFKLQGSYYLELENLRSPNFRIGDNVFDGCADFLLNYMRQQRCGFNPTLLDSCHTAGGYILYHPDSTKNNTPFKIFGGWHDASDYLQYASTTANAVYQMLFAFKENGKNFTDNYDAIGLKKSNGIPDILDEAKWGLDWLVKMNPSKDEMYAQLADDRDHKGMRLPNKDTFTYGAGHGLARPVYFANGKPQGIFKYQNQSTGVASLAGKYAAAFALASDVLKKYYPTFADSLLQKSLDAYQLGLKYPGVEQTAPCRAPYYYEEGNYTDDMELSAISLEQLTLSFELPNQSSSLLKAQSSRLIDEASAFGKQEPTTPWLGADTARHYQWYPFVNLGHYLLAKEGNKDFVNYLKLGLTKLQVRGANNAFLNGVPFIWCSNNLVAAALTQVQLYRKLTKDNSFLEMETSLRDWLFGCNAWGTSMIIGLPRQGISPRDPHSAMSYEQLAMSHEHGIKELRNEEMKKLRDSSQPHSFTPSFFNSLIPTSGGLVDGPIYNSIYSKLIGIKLNHTDAFAQFQSDYVVYHDDAGDYSSNEPTMDGTASLTYYFSTLENSLPNKKIIKEKSGVLTRFDSSQKIIRLVFTGHDFAEGGDKILKTLKKENIKASFFLTGDFYRKYPSLTKKLKTDGHYLGCHSDKHLLYCSFTQRDSLMVSKEQFFSDLRNNYTELSKLGIEKQNASYFLPPYEWYNDSIAKWCEDAGVNLINFTSGTSSNADYTTPDMKNYKSSETIYNNILNYELKSFSGLNGFILLTHIGAGPLRTDKFYDKLGDLIKVLKSKGYLFVPL